MNPNTKFHETHKVVTGLSPVSPSTSVPDYVSLKSAHKLAVIINVKNGSTVTANAITLKQASAVANTGEKALAFSVVQVNADVANGDTFTETAVVSNTFSPPTTNSLQMQYVIDVAPSDLDVANGFDCVRAGVADGANTVVSVVYILWPLKYPSAAPPSAIID